MGVGERIREKERERRIRTIRQKNNSCNDRRNNFTPKLIFIAISNDSADDIHLLYLYFDYLIIKHVKTVIVIQ